MRGSQLKLFLLTLLMVSILSRQNTPTFLMPVETTENKTTSYSVVFNSDTTIPHSAKIRISFPFEFEPGKLINFGKCEFRRGNEKLAEIPCQLSIRSFTIVVNKINKDEEMTIVITNIMNPTNVEMTSNFVVQTLFLNVVVTENTEFGKATITRVPSTYSFIFSRWWCKSPCVQL